MSINQPYPISDMHCHPSLKPVHNDQIETIWKASKNVTPKEIFRTVSIRKIAINMILKKMAVYTQTNLDNCVAGNNRLLICAIYPFERQFLAPDRPFNHSSGIRKFFLRRIFRKNLSEKAKRIDVKIIRLLAGVSELKAKEKINNAYAASIDYFNDYMDEYEYLINAQNSQSNEFPNKVFKMVRNYEELIAHINNPNIVCGILSLEGLHGLGTYKRDHLFKSESIDDLNTDDKMALINSFETRIAQIKENSPTNISPFFITFAHHFNNLILGHAKSFADATSKVVPGFSEVFNQRPGVNLGISETGINLIKELLNTDSGRRILIDTKHMSIQSRRDFYALINSLTFDESGNRIDRIPIICSHSAVSGVASLDDAEAVEDNNQTDKNAYVSKWDINLTDEDIIESYKTDGVIGICMHDGRMPGKQFNDLLKRHKKNKEKIRQMHIQMFLINVFHVVQVNTEHLGESSIDAWKTITLGSDNDGIIDPFDSYNESRDLTRFKVDIVHYINHYEQQEFKIHDLMNGGVLSNDQITSLMAGQTAIEIADRIFIKNMDQFLSNYFTETYITGQDLIA